MRIDEGVRAKNRKEERSSERREMQWREQLGGKSARGKNGKS
jgi:hypothetical protein